MAKGSGSTRSVGPGGAQAAPEVDKYAAWRAKETSEKYSLDPEKVRFKVESMDFGDVSEDDYKTRDNYEFGITTRDMDDGKYALRDTEWLMPDKQTTFRSAINAAVQEAKNRYKYAGRYGTRDSMIRVDTENGKLAAWVTSEMTADNRVRIVIDTFKYKD